MIAIGFEIPGPVVPLIAVASGRVGMVMRHIYIYMYKYSCMYIYIVSGPNHFIFWNPFSKVGLQERLKEVFSKPTSLLHHKACQNKGQEHKEAVFQIRSIRPKQAQ